MTVLNSTADEYVRGLIRYVHLAFETQRVVELRRVLRFLGAAYDITDLLAILLATLDDLQAIAAAVAEGSGRDVRHDAFDPDIVVAARVGADVDDQRACAGIAHASKRLASEGVELRFVAPSVIEPASGCGPASGSPTCSSRRCRRRARAGLRYARKALRGRGRGPRSLLDPAPLERSLRERVDLDALNANVRAPEVPLAAVAVAASSGLTGRTVVFHAGGGQPARDLARGIDYVPCEALTHDHVLASAAIPEHLPVDALFERAGGRARPLRRRRHAAQHADQAGARARRPPG